jgi:hypothetical protein
MNRSRFSLANSSGGSNPSSSDPGNGWDEFNQQLQGVSRFKMILKRD